MCHSPRTRLDGAARGVRRPVQGRWGFGSAARVAAEADHRGTVQPGRLKSMTLPGAMQAARG
ncbi:hypothetical protein GCM10010402_14370 [Actinomadura luteofluorescens]